MSLGGGNLYPNWLGSASLTIPNNTVVTTVSVSGQSYNTTVNIVPTLLMSTLSTATMNTNNPSEIFGVIVKDAGWYNTTFQGYGEHDSGSNWNQVNQLTWYIKVNNTQQSNTQTLVEPQYSSGDTVSEFVNMYGGGCFYAPANALIEWTTDGNHTGGSPITSGYRIGFGFITLQKIA